MNDGLNAAVAVVVAVVRDDHGVAAARHDGVAVRLRVEGAVGGTCVGDVRENGGG